MSDAIRQQLESALRDSYVIERELGGGGMSRIFVARDIALARQIVIKVLPTEYMGGVSVERFRREIQLAARLQQANIVPVLAAGEMNGLPYYTMPFVEGESLRAHMTARAALPIGEVISLARDMARALAAAHSLGIVHRDIKPENVLLSGGAAMVTDFGIARALHEARVENENEARAGTLTEIGTSLGTPAYMAPEQAAGDPSTDRRADIYAFGAVVYEMLAGRPVFDGKSAHDLVAAHMAQAPVSVLSRRPDTPPALAELVMRCLEKDPSARPDSAAALLFSLDAISQPAPPRRSRTMSMAMYGTGCVAVAVATRFAITGIGLPTWVLPSTLAVMALGVPAILLLKPKHSFGGGVVAASALLLVVAGYMTLRALGIGPVGSLFAEGVMKEKDYVVISDFRAVHADSTFGAILAEAVRTGLAQSTAISVVSVQDVDSALARLRHDPRAPLDLRTARDVAVREGAKAVVDGDVSGVAGGYVVSLRLVAAEDGRVLAAFHGAANSPQALIETADGLVRDLRAKVGESLRTVNAMPELYNQTTSSIDALKEFTLGISAGRAGNYEQAAEHYREATRLDSTFAMAWLNLSSILYDIEQRPAGGDSAQYRAYLLRDRLSHWERLLVTGTYLGLPYQRDPAGAIDAFQQMVDEGDSSQLGKLGTLLLNQRAYERAEPLIRAGMRAHPIRGGGLNLSAVLFNEGKIKEARAVFDSTYQLLPHNPLAARWAAEFAYQTGDLAGASRIADSLATSKTPAQRVWGLRRLGDLALLRGQRSRFERYWHDAEAVEVARGNAPAPQDSAIQFAYAEAWMSPTASNAAAHLDTALVHTPLDTSTSIDDYILATEVYALAGRPDRARAVLARYDALPMDSISRRLADPDRHRMLGDIALAEKHWPQAIAELKRSDSTAAGVPYGICRMCIYAWLGHAYDLAGMPDSAIVAYENYIKTPMLMRGETMWVGAGADPYLVGPTYRRLGELYDRNGDRAHAIEYYRRFVELWKDADPEFQPLVKAARERLAAQAR